MSHCENNHSSQPVKDLPANSPANTSTYFAVQKGLTHVPVGIYSVKNRLKLRVWLSFLNHGQIVAKGAQARLKLLVIESSRFVLVKVPKNKTRTPVCQLLNPESCEVG